LTDRLKMLGRESNATLFMTLAGVFAVLMGRYADQPDLAIGTPIANRTRREVEDLIGLFVNELVLRVNLGDNPTFLDLQKRMKQICLDAYAHQDVPLGRLVSELKPERSLSYSALFQVLFVLQNNREADFSLTGLQIDLLKTENRAAKFDLLLDMTEYRGSLYGSLTYNIDLFRPETIARMTGHFRTLLEEIVSKPTAPVNTLPLMTKEELRQVLEGFNRTKADYFRERGCRQLFEEQVCRSPDAVALICADQSLTYDQLNRRANRLAHYLRKRSVAPDVLVGLCMERSPDMLIGLLAILKAGGAYVPIDPAYPRDRIAFILEDARVSVLLTRQHLLAHLPPLAIEPLCWEQSESRLAALDMNPEHRSESMNLVYVIYTSGSTGKPKGVAIEQRSLLNLVQASVKHYELADSDRVLQFASISFDAAAEEIYPIFTVGGALILRDDEMLGSGSTFFESCRRSEVTVLDLPTSYWSTLVDDPAFDRALMPAALRLIIIGGDVAPPNMVYKWHQTGKPHPCLMNSYGPTETTVVVTVQKLLPGLPRAQRVPIGRPLANMQAYILDGNHQPVPIGVPGELYIGGEQVGRGYLNRPELTAEKFMPDSFGSTSGMRLYKTGDRARWLPDGHIEYLGRIDFQVKIRGFRIELEEIEAVLGQHPDVRATTVLAREDLSGAKQLAAYLAAKPGVHLRVEDLRSYMKSKLPEFMVPTAFVLLESLPLTPSGKVDHKALPIPEKNRFGAEIKYTAPRTPLEEEMTGIWSKLLGVERIGIHDNFFDLGGHSLLATQVISRLRQVFAAELSIRTFFEEPTIAGLAKRIENNSTTESKGLDLKAEAVLDPAIRFPDPATAIAMQKDFEYILLTGGTGFLGAFLLEELLQQTKAQIYCLVRAADEEQGKQKIKKQMKSFLLWQEEFDSRIIPVLGDLARPFLGVDPKQFEMLGEKLDIIYHNGAMVNFSYPYQALKKPNVLGTEECIRLAGTGRIKPLHYLSTLGVSLFAALPEDRVFREQQYAFQEWPAIGYDQSKWVAEQLVVAAGQRGLPVCIYRPGRIAGHSQTGACQANDFFWNFVRICIKHGMAPQTDNSPIELIPVDYISKAVVYLSKQRESQNKIFHFVNAAPILFKELATAARSMGYKLKIVRPEQWQKAIRKRSGFEAEEARFLSLFSEEGGSPEAEIKYDCRNTLKGLAGSSIACPEIDQALLKIYFAYFRDSGFFQPLHLG
ncbi:MAG: amino acid adenylation domain-containing protein, partial [Desulfobacteraceae bacterium]